MKQSYKKLSALVLSVVMMIGSVTAASAAQSRVVVRQISPQCVTESCPQSKGCTPSKSCPNTERCPGKQNCTGKQSCPEASCPQDQGDSLCDLLSRGGLTARRCEELGLLLKRYGNCPGNTGDDETAPAEHTENVTESPSAEPTDAPSDDAGDAPVLQPSEAEPSAPSAEPSVPPTETSPQQPTESADPTDSTAAPTEAAPSAEPEEDINSVSAFEKEVITLVNTIRHENGLGYLRADAQLCRIARMKSQDMREKGYFSHTSPTYGSPFDMLRQFGVSYRTAGENIAMGYRTPQAVVDGWMNSPGHRANILNENYTSIGVGYIAEGNYWTQLFAG